MGVNRRNFLTATAAGVAAASFCAPAVAQTKKLRFFPKLWHWVSQAWPPKYEELPLFLWRTAETVAMAAIGPTLATLIGLPIAILASCR